MKPGNYSRPQGSRCAIRFGLRFNRLSQGHVREGGGTAYGCMRAGFMSMAMLWRDETGKHDPAWIRFAWPWAQPAVISVKHKKMLAKERA
jgi:hypothetical protein